MAFRGHGPPDDPDAYWRRRFFILGGGFAVLMLAAWLFGSSGPSRQASQTAAARASTAAREAQGSLPSAAYGTPYQARPPLSASATPSPSPTGGAVGAPSPSPSASASASASAKASAAGKQCPAGSVVLSLFTSQPDYRPAEQPTFNVYAVSTSPAACQLKYGSAAVRVLVTRRGKVVWDSTACKATSQGARTVHLTPGVPQVVTLSWNRKASSQSCAGALSSGQWGTFQVVAQVDGHASTVRSFQLLR
jgi:hypothetical protein